METKFTLDLIQFGAGILVGLLASILMRLQSLKSLDLKLNRIGVDLGIQGFQMPSAEGAIQNTVKGDIGGDFVGRDKNTTNQSFYDKLQRFVSASGQRSEQAVARSSFVVHTTDSVFSDTLHDLQRSGDDWFYKYIDACLRRKEFYDPILARIAELRAAGWITRDITFDNHYSNNMQGLHISIEISRPVRAT